MKGVTRVTASLLAAAMTAGLGTTAAFAADQKPNVADPGADDTSVSTKWIEVFDKDSNLLASTDSEDEQVYDLHNTDPDNDFISNDTTAALDIYLPVGSSKTLTAKLDDDSAKVNTAKFGYADTNKDNVINNKDTVQATNAKNETKATAVRDVVSLENGTFTAKLAGVVTFYAYASDATKLNSATSTTSANTTLEDAGKYIEINVYSYYLGENSFTLEFVNRDTAFVDGTAGYTNGAVTQDTVNSATKKAGLGTPSKDYTTKKLYYHGSKLVNHKDQGGTADFTVKMAAGLYDDADTDTTLKFGTTAPKYLSVTGDNTKGTVTAYGTAPVSGLGKVFAYVDKNDNGKYDASDDTVVSNYLAVVGTDGVAIYRVYNPNSGEHLYTKDASEKDNLVSLGWQDEGIGWYAPETSARPVYRVYNPVAGEHVYTTSESEVKKLVAAGWNNEDVKFYSASEKYYPIYRQYNANEFANNHNYTGNVLERTFLVGLGWKDEGVVLNAVQLSEDTINAAANYAKTSDENAQ